MMIKRTYGVAGYRPTRAVETFKLPPRGSLPDHVPCKTLNIPIRDQLSEGACGGFGMSRALQAVLQLLYPLSPQFSYWNGKLTTGMQLQDSGVFIADVVDAALRYGICPESAYPYVEGQFNQMPPYEAYRDGMPVKGLFKAVALPRSSQAVLQALAQPNTIVIDGSSIFSFFESDEMARTGVLRVPKPGEAYLGGHCTIHTGYDLRCIDAPFPYTIKDNSWNDTWALAGRYKQDLAYIDDDRGFVGDLHAIMPA